MDWKAQLDKIHALLEEASSTGEGVLRFRLPYVEVSDLAQQYYCEKEVELSHVHGKRETEEMTLGSVGHQELLKDTVKVKREELWHKIHSGQRVAVREMLLLAKHKGVMILGRTDAAFFHGGRPLVFLEHKFTKRLRPFRDHHVQARLYGYLLHRMGFDTSRLRYALIYADPDLKDREELRKDVFRAVIKRIGNDAFTVDVPGRHAARVYLSDFRLEEAITDLEWALDYWVGKRDAVPTKKPQKCKTCPFNDVCEDSLAKPEMLNR